MLNPSLRYSQGKLPRIGILGGGHLGRMLLQAAANYPVQTFILENDDECPAAHLCHHFTKGDIKDFDAVFAIVGLPKPLSGLCCVLCAGHVHGRKTNKLIKGNQIFK